MTLNTSQQAIVLIKFFSEEKHYLAFKGGSSIFRTPHYFRQSEDSGRGDRAESCLGYWNRRLGDNVPHLTLDGRTYNTKDAESILIYPAYEQQDAWLQSWCMIGPHNGFEHSLERMLDEFGTYFVVLPATKIGEYARLLAQASDLPVRCGLVRYSDDPLERSLTVKDAKYGYQKEYRFFIGQCDKDEVKEMPLQLQGIDRLVLSASSLRLTSPSGLKSYCSLGRRKVVKVS